MKTKNIILIALYFYLLNTIYAQDVHTGRVLVAPRTDIDVTLESYKFIGRDGVIFQDEHTYTAGNSNFLDAFLDETVITNDYNLDEVAGLPIGRDREIDETKAVGTTAGAFNVSSSGAATYSIPITVPRGLGGLTPQLSLNYNSMTQFYC
jgi:hypothetical protein